MGGYRSYQSPEAYRSDSIGDLILQGGRDAAAGAQRSGDIWGRAISGAGQAVSQGLEQYGAEKKQKAAEDKLTKRDAAWLSYVDSGEWTKDPQAAYANSVRVFGPKDGAVQFQALQGASKLMQQDARDPAKDGQAAGYLIRGMGGLGNDEARKVLWPRVRELAIGAKLLDGTKAPEEFDPKLFNDVLLPMVPSLLGEKPAAEQGFTLSPGQQRFGPGGESLAAVPEKPPAGHMVTTPGPDGRPVQRLASAEELAGGIPAYREPKEPRAPREEKLERIETVGPDGKPVTQFVNPRAGASYARPTGAGKASTGQQKKALNYFNRARDAHDIASTLEDSNKVNASRVKWTPDILNVTLDDDSQAYVQAKRAFTESKLRKDSGAAIKDSEYEADDKTFFQQPGDSPATVQQKQAARRRVQAGMAHESGDALKEFYGDEAEGMIEGYRNDSTATKRSGAKRSGAAVRVSSPAEAKKLPKGTKIILPDGTTGTVP